MTQHDLDLTKTHFVRTFGDITAIGAWFGQKKRPALVLAPTARLGIAPIIPCVVPLSSAWKWAEETGDGRLCARLSVSFADYLGLNSANVRDVMRVTSIIRECLGDLISMPPKPIEDSIVVADIIRTDESGKQQHHEVIENV
ncbi:hypothetical protein [Methylosinus sp. PW1]|uniref:hypothetical protein n=1 Tax=Methylosinus sp. PW1 TaxID=107636 RepID=UPI000567594D|nr:hypothetical protein [Methylosinus sp. PW1]